MALEVNDFNAIRISLASPEQIRSWSYGEVIKPETINYRTLKPEKDGLFCEKIFGPSKDFECYCGKYKRVRYKGIICDKCGVEVTRSKVRRERMGNIELAAPVAHSWFAKGTPSRIGLLLDVSPRSLERVLYFAQYIVTSVNEEARDLAVQRLKDQMDEALAKEAEKGETPAEVLEIETNAAEAVKHLEAKRSAERERINKHQGRDITALEKKAAVVAKDMERFEKKKATKDVAIGDVVFVVKGSFTEGDAGERLRVYVEEQRRDVETTYRDKLQQLDEKIDASIQSKKHTASLKSEKLLLEITKEQQGVHQEFEKQIDELEDLHDPIRSDRVSLLQEHQYATLIQSYPDVFTGGMGAEAIAGILERLDLEQLVAQLRNEIQNFSGQRRKKATKRLRVAEAFRKSGNRPSWMILTVLPVLPPDLRPMVQLDGGRFATSDLNDLYRRVINRNNRLKRLLELGAPEIIIRNEKRMLQEAVDSLIDNGRRGRAVSTAGNHRLKCLSDMLKGKQGRFRQNLLGKRVDYSGRSVIVVGPELKLHQCGIPKRMALELFKPLVMHALVARGLAHNIKSAKRIVERARPEVWDILDKIIKERPVLLNRAPTLHRLGIQAFEPVLIDGSAIRISPLVCTAFNADFDGDQMAVHVPLSRTSVAEARQVMLSTKNLLLPSNGEPVVAPTLDIVLGCYYLTMVRLGTKGEYKKGEDRSQTVYGSFDEAKLAYDMGLVGLQACIRVRDPMTGGEIVETSVGRIIFNDAIPEEMGFRNAIMDKKAIKDLVAECHQQLGNDCTAEMVDKLKAIGFHYGTTSGISIAMNDLQVPGQKERLLTEADAQISEIEQQYQMGLITEEESYAQVVGVWRATTERMQQLIQENLDQYGSVYIMATSGAKGNISQISQMAGMRGLMTDPSGRIIELPIRSSFREGLTVLEYFISTHGARKGLADTALRTADSGYLTRRLIDVAQDVIVMEEDCGTTAGIWLSETGEKGLLESLPERIVGRYAAADIAEPTTGEVLLERNHQISLATAMLIADARIDRVFVRSTLTCQAKRGICAFCYGRDLARGELVQKGEAVGIIAAQSIGEPGTQLTMRTFHTGGVAGPDITSGLPRVEELFEARVPKGAAVISEIDGKVEIFSEGDLRHIRVESLEAYREDYSIPRGTELVVTNNQWVEQGAVLARPKAAKGKVGDNGDALTSPEDNGLRTRMSGRVLIEKRGKISVLFEEHDEREYQVHAFAHIRVQDGETIQAGTPLTDGPLNPQDILRIQGPEALQMYMVEEVQKVYRSQGVTINDKHIETIVRQMLRKVRIDSHGDTALLPGELVDRFAFEKINAEVLAEGGEPATAQPVLLGVTKASLNTESFLAAASFQETTRVLTEAAATGRIDHLTGLKENVIIGKLIPAQAPVEVQSLLPPDDASTVLLGGSGDGDQRIEGLAESLQELTIGVEPMGSGSLAGGEERLNKEAQPAEVPDLEP